MARVPARWRIHRVPAERLPTIEMSPALALRNPMVGLLEIDVTRARRRLRAHRERTGERLSFTAFVVACVAHAVARHPAAHAMRRGRRVYVCDQVDVATLVEVDAGGVTVPVVHVVRDAGRRTVDDVHREIRSVQHDPGPRLAEVRRQVTLLSRIPRPLRWLLWRGLARAPHAWQRLGGTVAVSPVGMFGRGRAWGIGLPAYPLSVTVGGIVTAGPSPDGGPSDHRELLCLTVALDHDVIDGAPAARFVTTLRQLLEEGFGLVPAPDELASRPAAPTG